MSHPTDTHAWRSLLVQLLSPLVGGTIIDYEYPSVHGFLWPTLLVACRDGKVLAVIFNSDAEGNHSGYPDVVALPRELASAALQGRGEESHDEDRS